MYFEKQMSFASEEIISAAPIIQLLNILAVSVPFILLAFLSCDFVISAFSCFIFLFALSKPNKVNLFTIFIVSLFIDIYYSQLVGISFAQFSLIYFAVIQFRMLLLNCRIIFGIYFFLLLLLAAEALYFVITSLFFGSCSYFDLNRHFERISVAVFLCCLYCFGAYLNRRIAS